MSKKNTTNIANVANTDAYLQTWGHFHNEFATWLVADFKFLSMLN